MLKTVGSVVFCVVGVAFVASGCSDSFESCKETRTCTPTLNEGGEAGESAAGSPSSQGGEVGSGGSSAGTAGLGGAGGAGGAGGEPSPGGTGSSGEAGMAGAGGDPNACAYVTCECEEGATQPCGPEEAVGICKPGEQTCSEGGWGECIGDVEAAPRDCTSASDNDCDGKPDNTIDDSCKCVPGTKEACGEHPGQDGNGPCKAGERVCEGTGSTGVWGPCEGSVGPKATDRCDVAGNDDNCDDQENGGCTCLSGEKSNCLDVYGSKGVCSPISLTCTATGKWPSSTTCAATKTEVCAADNKDEDCDGTVNDGCACTNGAIKVCGSCDEGTQTCVNGAWAACNAAPLSLNKGPKMLCIPGGTFSMGSNRNTNEKPIHSVTLPSFWMDESEVTYGQYTACVNDGGKCTKGRDILDSSACATGAAGKTSYPMNCVDQLQAAAFCTWAGKRLPIEEEWEYGARGANTYLYPWGNDAFVDQANLHATGPVPIMQFPNGKSPFGLWDMTGNVQEWVASGLCTYAAAGITPSCGSSHSIQRGGSYRQAATVALSAAAATTTYRTADDPTGWDGPFGFRCARNK